MIKKSVVSGLMLSTSVLGIAGCSVPQKEAVSNNAEHVTAKDPASEVTPKLASSVASRQENRPEQPVSTTFQETVVPMTQAPTISADALKQEVAEELAAKPAETPVVNNAQVVETNTYQAKPIFVELSAPKVVAPTVEPTVNATVEKPVEVENASAHNEVVEKQDEKATVEATPAVTENKQDVATEESVQSATEKPVEPVSKEEPKAETVEKPAEVVEQPAPQAQPQAQPQAEPVVETPAVEEKVQEPAPTVQPEARQHPQYNSDASSYPTGQCTWGVKTVAPWVGDYWGNGGQWAESAARDGFRTGKTAEVGSVASWDDGGYGHVAYVTDVDPATGYVKVLEANYNGDQSIGDHRGWFDASNPTWGNVTYIYQN